MATNPNKRTQLIITCNTQQAQDMLRKWEAELKQAKAEMKQLADAGKTSSARFQQLDRDVKNLSKSISQNKSQMERVDNVMKNLSTFTLRQLRLAAKDVKKEMDRMSTSDPKLKELQQNLQKINNQMRQIKGETTAASNSMASAWKKTALAVSSYFGVPAVIGRLVHMFSQLKKELFEYSDQMANIRKVSGLAYSEITKLTNNLAKLDTRTSIQELNQIAYAGAKLGIGKWGTEALEGFVKAANKVNVALKEDMGDEALTALAKMTEVMGLIPKMGVEKSMLATGSAIFQLGATSTANASNIVEFSKRLMGMSRVAGITVDQLLAVGSASDAMGLMPEVSATAFNKLISSLQKNHNLIEKELAIEPGTINELYSAGRAMDAMVLIFEKMKEKGNMNALGSVFKPLGSEGARLVNVMVTMANRVDMLKDHLYTAETAFEEASAVTNEYNIQQETAAALMERASNAWDKAFVNSEGVDAIKTMAQGWYDFSVAMSTSTVYMGSAKLALNAIYLLIRGILMVLPVFINYLMMRGVVAAISMVWSAMVGFAGAIRSATVATSALNLATKANPLALLATVIMTAVMALSAYKNKAEEVSETQRTINDFLVAAARDFDRESRALQNYLKVANDVNLSTENRQKLIKKFNHEYSSYLTKLGLEVKDAKSLQKAYEQVNAEIKKKMYYQMRDRAYEDILGKENESQTKGLLKYNELTTVRMPELRAYSSSWLMDQIRHGKGTESVFMSMMQGLHGEDNIVKGKGGIWLREQNGGFNTRNLTGSDSEESKLFWAIDAVIKSTRAYDRKKYNIDSAFKDLIGDYNPNVEEPLGTLDNEAPDKAALAQAKRDREAHRKALREELKQDQNAARAVLDNIKNFYQRQITEILRTANENGWDEQLLQLSVDSITMRQNEVLAQARKAIAGKKNDWETVKEQLRADMIEKADDVGYNESSVLLDDITTNNLKALHDHIAGLAKELGMPNNAATDAIWKNSTLNEKANETATQRRLRERQKKLLEDNYTASVDNQYNNSMTQLGYFDVNEQQSSLLRNASLDDASKTAATDFLKLRAGEIQKVFANTRSSYAELISLDTDFSKQANKDSLLRIIFGGDGYKNTTLTELLNLSAEDMEQFYGELLKYANDYTEALKKAHDRQEKLITFKWERSAAYTANLAAQSSNGLLSKGVAQFHPANQVAVEGSDVLARRKSDVPQTGVYGNSAFMSSFGFDPEVESYRLKMEAAAEYYDFVKAQVKDAQTIRDAENAMLDAQMQYAKSVADQVKARMDALYELAAPVEQFGSAVGEAFATMTEDAEAGRAALKAAIGDMINAFLKQTVTMSQEYIKRQILQQSNDRIVSKMMHDSSKEQQDIEEDKNKDLNKVTKQGGKSILKSFTGWIGDKLKFQKKSKKTEAKVEQQSQTETENIVNTGEEAKSELKLDAETNMTEGLAEVKDSALNMEQEQAKESVNTTASETSANTTMGIASGAAKIIGKLGWWGIPLVAVITALLNGLLSMAMSKVTSLFGGGSDSSDSGASTKLVTGMLTYDSGNVQAFRGVTDGRSYPVVGNDGKVYAATDGGELSTGLVSDPITTLVNGQPALVAERGPEMVIGRETTAAMMMARPDILAEIVKFDRNRSGQTYRAYDQGNVSDFSITTAASLSADDLANLRTTIDSLSSVLTNLQQNGIQATINKYGRGGLAESAQSGANFMRRNSGDRLWRNS